MVNRELSWKAKPLIYHLIYVPTLTCGYELWVRSKSRSWIQAAKMSFLCRVAGLSLKVRSSDILREF